MQDTADATEAAGQPEAAPETDEQAEQILAAAMQQPEEAAPQADADPKPDTGGRAENGDGKPDAKAKPEAKGDPWGDPEAARKEIERLRRENAGHRTRLKQAEPQLAEYQKYLDSQKTEQQRLTEAKEAAETEARSLRSANARLMAAATHNLPADLIDDLGDGTEEEIDARAQRLAELLAAAEQRGEERGRTAATPTEPPKPQASPTRPVESLRPGASPAGDGPTDPNDVLRGLIDRRRG